VLSFQFRKLIIDVRQKARATSFCFGGRDNVVGLAIRYRLGGPGLKSRWERDLPDPSRPSPRPTQPSVQSALGLLPWGKVAMTWQCTPSTHLAPRLNTVKAIPLPALCALVAFNGAALLVLTH
jgi:hypothetical protein